MSETYFPLNTSPTRVLTNAMSKLSMYEPSSAAEEEAIGNAIDELNDMRVWFIKRGITSINAHTGTYKETK